MVFHWSLSDKKSRQVSRSLLSILAVLNNAIVWMVSTRPPTSKSSSPFSNPLVTVPNTPITIGIIVTSMFHSFFNSQARSRYQSFFSHSFSFILWSAGTAKSTILQVLFFCCWLLLSLYYCYYYYYCYYCYYSADVQFYVWYQSWMQLLQSRHIELFLDWSLKTFKAAWKWTKIKQYSRNFAKSFWSFLKHGIFFIRF